VIPGLVHQNQIRFEVQVLDQLSPVHADCEEVILLFHNLVNNAIKYNKQDGRVRMTAEQDRPCARVSVSDTGIGISKESLSRLFSEFFGNVQKCSHGDNFIDWN